MLLSKVGGNDMKETFGQRLARLRKEKGYTQEDVASKITISPQAVSKWENDNSEPDLDTLNKLADIFSCSVDELLGRDKVETQEENKAEAKEEHASEVVEKKCECQHPHHHTDKIFWITTSSLLGLAVVAYIVMGLFWTDQYMGWKMGWLVFFLPFIISSIAEAIRFRLITRINYPFIVVFTYLLLGFLGGYLGFQGWAIYWFLFLTIPAFYLIFGPVDGYLKAKRGIKDEDDDDDEDDD